MTSTQHSPVPCLLDTWATTEAALYRWLTQHCSCQDLAYDLLQETFLRALQRERAFCDIENQKAWLFTVAKNLLVDEWRKSGRLESISESNDRYVLDIRSEREPIESLAQCLPKALAYLSEDDRSVIEFCDLQGHSQQEFAKLHHLTVTAVKSRIQRARPKLQAQLKVNCHITFDEQHKVCCFTPKRS